MCVVACHPCMPFQFAFKMNMVWCRARVDITLLRPPGAATSMWYMYLYAATLWSSTALLLSAVSAMVTRSGACSTSW